ncbi:hypothetical protein BCR44DRAFT_60060 [Catenaria anguillulae PL171]|uniref:Uncharacterized protein n=1 Tax=Catenaria anguillulae PL171 TaxID=765915 RepID=A0A1Y2HYW0_9FUNG|nr:hypothetical protein BCR44DRAFT_60060 [Catenaria anguillulae PL171]
MTILDNSEPHVHSTHRSRPVAYADADSAIRPLTLSVLPVDILELIVYHLAASFDPSRPQLPLRLRHSHVFSLALTCRAVAAVAIPALYKTILLSTLPSITKLFSTLAARPDLAAKVKVVALAQTCLDQVQNDIDRLFGPDVKKMVSSVIPGSSIPDPFRAQFFGRDTLKSSLMAWFVHIAQVCPNLVGVDLSRTALSPYLALGFPNLADILRERGGWFKPPGKSLMPVSTIRVADPAGPQHRPFIPHFVTGLDFGRRILDIAIVPDIRGIIMYNVVEIGRLIPSGNINEELKKWRIRNVSVVKPGKQDPWAVLPVDIMCNLLGLRKKVHTFDLRTQRVDNLPVDPSIGRPAGTFTLTTGTLPDAYDILKDRNFTVHDVKTLNLGYTFQPPSEPEQRARFDDFMREEFRITKNAMSRLRTNPWLSVRTLTLGNPLFRRGFGLKSMHMLADFAGAFPNVTALTIRPVDTSIADVLLAVDPFVRRCDPVGKPITALGIVRKCDEDPEDKFSVLPAYRNSKNKVVPPPARSHLRMDGPTKGHLKQLVLTDAAISEVDEKMLMNEIMIHPGLMHSIEYANLRGVRLTIAPPSLATPDSPSFPSIQKLPARSPALTLAHVCLPNLRALAINGDFELPSNPHDADSAAILPYLPKCPNLESLVIDTSLCEGFSTVEPIVDLVSRFPNLHQVCLAYLDMRMPVMQQLADALFGHPIRELRPAPYLNKLVGPNIPGDAPIPFERDPESDFGIYVMGEAGTTYMSNVQSPSEFVLGESLIAPLGDSEMDAGYNAIPLVGQKCLCGRKKMGVDFTTSEPGRLVWVHPSTSEVTCTKCSKSEIGRVVVTKLGVKIKKVVTERCETEYESLLGPGVWHLQIPE